MKDIKVFVVCIMLAIVIVFGIDYLYMDNTITTTTITSTYHSKWTTSDGTAHQAMWDCDVMDIKVGDTIITQYTRWNDGEWKYKDSDNISRQRRAKVLPNNR